MRAFIALELSPGVQQVIAALQDRLRASLPQARWTKPSGTHLTLKFLGDAPESLVPQISGELDTIAGRHAPLALALAKVGAFPRLAFPRVLWVGLEPNDSLLGLQTEVESSIAPLGFPSEKRPFVGHLTLARLAGESWSPELQQHFLGGSELCRGISWTVDRIILFRSDLKPSGAVYSPVYSGVFQGSSASP